MKRNGSSFRAIAAGLLFAGAALSGVHADDVSDRTDYGPLPAIGSSDVALADPLVTRPSTTPCSVPLFTDAVFNDYSTHPFDYTPPAGCAGPWKKIVLTFDLSVTTGVQYDRTGTVWIGGVNLFFGTTAEPRSTLGPTWHVERDITDESSLLALPQSGNVFIGNIVNSTYTGVIHGTATVLFYPLAAPSDPHQVPYRVIGLGSDPVGATVDLNHPGDQLTKTLTLPTNIVFAYLDVIAQAQGSDEFWWSCMPDDVAPITNDCPGSAFREVEVTIDGGPAGVAPVYPWVYTGGVQPALWSPIPGVQTLNFKPYRVNLTPFAGILSDGNSHTIALSIFNAHEHWSTTATLLLQLGGGSTQQPGVITTNTLTAAPAPVVTSTVDASGIGTVSVDSNRSFTIASTVGPDDFRVQITIEQTFSFNTTTTYASTQETLTQSTTVDTKTTSSVLGAVPSTYVVTDHLSYPFSFTYSASAIDFDQRLDHAFTTAINGSSPTSSSLSNHVATHHASAAANRHSEQDYEYSDSFGNCYSRDITSAANKLATVTDAVPCIAAETIFADGFEGAP